MLQLHHVIDDVTNSVNFIRSRAALLEEDDTEHGDIGDHTAVRRPSLGKELRGVRDLKAFCEKKG